MPVCFPGGCGVPAVRRTGLRLRVPTMRRAFRGRNDEASAPWHRRLPLLPRRPGAGWPQGAMPHGVMWGVSLWSQRQGDAGVCRMGALLPRRVAGRLGS